jgi:S-adenosylmethionine:tRNA ribosyltransferase-isomerase
LSCMSDRCPEDDVALYDYDLPPELIAQAPIEPRDSSRLLHLPREEGPVRHLVFRDLPGLLEPGDLLVLNDTRVSARRLLGRRPTGGAVELLLLRRLDARRYEALTKPARRLKPGSTVLFDEAPAATVIEALEAGVRVVEFEEDPGPAGETPLPPYYHGTLDRPERYQTVYAETDGSAAAPTAGLHFTRDLLQAIEEKGIRTATVTLHIGMDTFRPVPEGRISEHRLRGEVYTLPEQAAQAIRECQGRVIAVGSTSVRVIESAGPREGMRPGSRLTRLFIRPGYRFRTVAGMVTNFHLPRTTMLVMVCALAGRERILRAYEEAKRTGYRFLSFGDAMAVL